MILLSLFIIGLTYAAFKIKNEPNSCTAEELKKIAFKQGYLADKAENIQDALKRLKSNKITVVYIGDAALEEGIFFECANFASLHKLPILFACENNLFSVYTPLKQRQINSDFKKYADAFRIPYKRINGNNVEQVLSD